MSEIFDFEGMAPVNGEANFDLELYQSVKLDKELKSDLINLTGVTRREIKTVVDLFYQVQKDRVALENQIRAIEQDADEESKDKNNTIVLSYLLKNMKIMETNTANIIQKIVDSSPVGNWLMQIKGIGPVLAAGLLAYFDVEDKNYASHFISYAGLNDNNRPWLGTEKSKEIVNDVIGKSKVITDDMVAEISARTQWKFTHLRDWAWDEEKEKWSKADLIKACAIVPYNKKLKVLLHKVGSSFQWNCNKPDSLYGTLFSERRIIETQKNEAGAFADQAKRMLETKNIGKDTTAYKEYSKGRLPKAHITARAMRYAEKIFVSHLFEEMYRVRYDQVPPRYYILDHSDEHHDEIAPEIPYTKVTGEM